MALWIGERLHRERILHRMRRGAGKDSLRGIGTIKASWRGRERSEIGVGVIGNAGLDRRTSQRIVRFSRHLEFK